MKHYMRQGILVIKESKNLIKTKHKLKQSTNIRAKLLKTIERAQIRDSFTKFGEIKFVLRVYHHINEHTHTYI